MEKDTMETSNFIDQIAAGDAAAAKETLNDLISDRAFQALDARKIELAQTIFNGTPEVEVQDTADTEIESEVEETEE